MTPMVDLTFLLVTFFMLSHRFAGYPEPVALQLPTASSLPVYTLIEKYENKLLLTKDGKVFLDIDPKIKRALIVEMSSRYGIQLTEKQLNDFDKLALFGIDFNAVPSDIAQQYSKEAFQPGIPINSNHNQLADWLMCLRKIDPKSNFSIKADEAIPYPLIRKVFYALRDNDINRFGLYANPDFQDWAASIDKKE